MALRGTIVKSNNGSNPYTARFANGEFIGNFPSVQQAQQPIELAANRKLRWVEEGRLTSTEAWRGEDPT